MIPVLHTDRLRLRGHTWADFPAFAAMWQEPEVARFIPFAPVPVSQSWARFNGNVSRWVRAGHGNWTVTDKSGHFLGVTGFFIRDGRDGPPVLESGWVFASVSHGNGYATEAVRRAHGWLDAQPFGGCSICMMGVDHRASIGVAQKVGYRPLRVESDPWGKVQIMERRRG